MIESSQSLAFTRRFRLGGILQSITLHIWRDDVTLAYSAIASHAIRTPQQASPNLPPPAQFAASAEAAAENVMHWYDVLWMQAVEAGFAPSDDWLVEG